MINFMLSQKVIIIRLIVGLMKRISLYEMSCFREPPTHSKTKMKVELDLSYYATESDLKVKQLLINSNLLKWVI